MPDTNTTPPWERSCDEQMSHYRNFTTSLGQTAEYVEEEAARDWAENGAPRDGDRRGEYFVRGGQLWNDGKYGAADGSAEPYVVQAQVEAAWAEHEAGRASQNDGWAR